MSRSPLSNDTVVIKPTNNVYTTLVVVATLFVIIGAVVIFSRATHVFGVSLIDEVPVSQR